MVKQELLIQQVLIHIRMRQEVTSTLNLMCRRIEYCHIPRVQAG